LAKGSNTINKLMVHTFTFKIVWDQQDTKM